MRGNLKLLRVLSVFCIILFSLLASANASIVTFQFAGNVTQVPIDEAFGDIDFGDAIQGSFSFDTTAADLIPGDPTTGSYNFASPLGMNVSIGLHDFDAHGSLNIGIVNSFVDQFTVLATNADQSLTLELFLQDSTGGVFANDHLPSTVQQLAAFQQRDFHLNAIFAAGEVQVDGQLTAVSAVATPEPTSQGPMLAAFLFLALALRRRLLQATN